MKKISELNTFYIFVQITVSRVPLNSGIDISENKKDKFIIGNIWNSLDCEEFETLDADVQR